MKAVLLTRYGGPQHFAVGEIDEPVAGPGQVLVNVRAVGINAADWRMLKGFIPRMSGLGFFSPKQLVLGADIAGVVTSTGSDVTNFEIGDAVYGDLSNFGYGGLAEYVLADEDLLVKKPDSISFETAACSPLSGVTAWRALKDAANLQAGMTLAINGASGGVGMFAVLLGKALGAEVTAVCSQRNHDLVRQLGVTRVIDYRQSDFTEHNERYDVILGVNGHHPLKHYERVLNPGGSYIALGGDFAQIFAPMLKGKRLGRKTGKSFTTISSKMDKSILENISPLLASGEIKPHIDQVYQMEQASEAFQYVVDQHPRGKVVIQISGDTD